MKLSLYQILRKFLLKTMIFCTFVPLILISYFISKNIRNIFQPQNLFKEDVFFQKEIKELEIKLDIYKTIEKKIAAKKIKKEQIPEGLKNPFTPIK